MYLYIYIYIERERERYRDVYASLVSGNSAGQDVTPGLIRKLDRRQLVSLLNARRPRIRLHMISILVVYVFSCLIHCGNLFVADC